MAGFFRGVALDLDGTLVADGAPSSSVLAAVEDLRDGGLACLLVTGRIVGELAADFSGLLESFDACVAENGGVLVTAADSRLLASPVDPELSAALDRLGVPCRRGELLLACDGADTSVVASEVARGSTSAVPMAR